MFDVSNVYQVIWEHGKKLEEGERGSLIEQRDQCLERGKVKKGDKSKNELKRKGRVERREGTTFPFNLWEVSRSLKILQMFPSLNSFTPNFTTHIVQIKKWEGKER